MKKTLADITIYLLVVFLVLAITAQVYEYVFTEEWKEETSGYFYGNWAAVIFSVALLSIFFLAFLKPLKKRNWREFGITEAYIVALFTEMFGIPLTIYFLTSVAGYNIGFSGFEGHLWATMLANLGIIPLESGFALVMVISTILIGAGLILMAVGWREVYFSEGRLIITGIYSKVRHPQYTGFILVLIGFLIQWPTIITLIMFPFLVYMYYRLARREEKEMVERFGDEYREYMRRTNMFLPYLKMNLVTKIAPGEYFCHLC